MWDLAPTYLTNKKTRKRNQLEPINVFQLSLLLSLKDVFYQLMNISSKHYFLSSEKPWKTKDYFILKPQGKIYLGFVEARKYFIYRHARDCWCGKYVQTTFRLATLWNKEQFASFVSSWLANYYQNISHKHLLTINYIKKCTRIAQKYHLITEQNYSYNSY